MDQDDRSRTWTAFENALPNLCYITRTREVLMDLLDKAKDLDDLIQMLARATSEEPNVSFRADLKILKQKLEDAKRRLKWEGSLCFRSGA